MDELMQWLRAQFDKEERIARAAPLGPWSVDGAGSIVDAGGGRVVPSVGGTLNGRVSRWPEGPAVAHILGHGPARVLREIDAKRQLLDEHHDMNDGDCATCVDGQWGYPTHGGSTPQRFPCRTLRLLALAYADRPGYRDEWRP